jgi:hypothetical protein
MSKIATSLVCRPVLGLANFSKYVDDTAVHLMSSFSRAGVGLTYSLTYLHGLGILDGRVLGYNPARLMGESHPQILPTQRNKKTKGILIKSQT